ncbi:VanZ family protein [Paenibacillus soyae]|uniref:VanZ family protein n=1 Tax=Paenibacillus soyae TaxID=2969249 RepID=A0A9X2MWT6_9BACL|nr:VanZ family protein [Paenibacillus soyae]MCR2807256.1 VanZ family protein [Paenibacillus soyae]
MRKFVYWAVVILWMALIIFFSHQPASSSDELSTGVTEVIVVFIEQMLPNTDVNALELNHAVRKNAHFFIYFILAILVLGTLTKFKVRGMRGVVASLLICVCFAISDELHQLFVVGRGAQVADVFIDSVGAWIGVGLFKSIERIRLWFGNGTK